MNIYFEKHTTRTPPAAIDNANIGNLFITERKFPFFFNKLSTKIYNNCLDTLNKYIYICLAGTFR